MPNSSMNDFVGELPKISIVTPSLNQGQFIDECIQSVLFQNYPNFEHIIIDGGSTDGTLEILQSYLHLKWISEPDMGTSDALNKGFRMAEGEIVAWIGTDDRYLPNCFCLIANYFNEYPDIDIVYGNYNWIDEYGNLSKRRYELGFDLFMLKYLHILYIPVVATFFNKRIFNEGNYLSLDYNYANDYEFILRIALQRYKFQHIKAFLSDFRWHPHSNSTLSSAKQTQELERALFKLDPFLSQFQSLSLGRSVYKLLRILARAKRYILKFYFYFGQRL